MIATQHYLELPDALFERTAPAQSPRPRLVELNRELLAELGVQPDWFGSDEALGVLSGNQSPENVPTLALAYAGHQFGQWVPLLGDGRAHVLGQITDANRTVDVQLKGSGRTRFSRRGDGRATLGSVLREYLVSEAMAALSIPTTRSLAIIETGEPVMRERAFPGAILARTAESHVRVGTFEFAHSMGIREVRSLADFVIDKHYPDIGLSDAANGTDGYLALLQRVAVRQAELIAQWMLVGFIHGVMNTDNTSVVGETIDYGPCAFMDEFDAKKVFSSIDRFGRYAWDQQPAIGYWNLSRLANALLPLIDDSPETAATLANEALEAFADTFQNRFACGMRRKLGVNDKADLSDWIQETFASLTDSGIDFTRFFDELTHVASGGSEDPLIGLFGQRTDGIRWLEQWRKHRDRDACDRDTMRRANPAVIARNHRVEQAIDAAVNEQDFSVFRRLCRVVRNPYEVAPADRDLQTPPTAEERVTETFCGT